MDVRRAYLGLVAILWLGTLGCRGRAQQDVYQQKLVQEVRLLEDELYQADYENRVLLDKLQQAKRHVAEFESEMGSGVSRSPRPKRFEPRNKKVADRVDVPIPTPLSNDSTNSEPLGDPPKPEPLDAGTDSAGSGSTVPREPDDEDLMDIPDIDDLVDPGTLVPSDSNSMLPPPRSSTTPESFPETVPPSEPIPPGGRELEFEPIEKGIPIPPRSPSGQPDTVPGQITLPPGLGMLSGDGKLASSSTRLVLRPTQMAIDLAKSQTRYATSPPLSEGSAGPVESQTSETSIGVDLHVRFIDQHGRPISLQSKPVDPLAALSKFSQSDVQPGSEATPDRQLQIAVFDPEKPESERRLGQWVFGPDELATLHGIARDTETPKELTVPIRWQQAKPSGNRVVVLAKLTSRNTDLRCDAEIPLKASPTSIGWRTRSGNRR